MICGVWNSVAPKALTAETRPNIVLAVVDTLRADKLGCYGDASPASRELDELARSGVRFENTIAQASWTRSSMAAMLSGLFPRRTGVVREQWDVLEPRIETTAEILQRSGYRTLGITANPQLNRNFGFAQGFDEYIESTVLFSWMEKESGKQKASREVAVRTAADILHDAEGLIAKSSEGPYYLQMLLMDVHAHHRIKPQQIDADLKAFPDAAYLQAVRNATRPLARFLGQLLKNTTRETIVIVTADHGEGLNDFSSLPASKGHGNLLYRSLVHVPWLVVSNRPEKLPAHTVGGVTQLIDIAPTIVELSGAQRMTASDGTSRAALLQQNSKNSTVRSDTAVTFSETRWRKKVNKSAAINGEWYYVENRDGWPGTAPKELQPARGPQDGAKTDLSQSQSAEAAKLKSALDAWELTLPKPKQDVEKKEAPISSDEIKQLKSLGYLG